MELISCSYKYLCGHIIPNCWLRIHYASAIARSVQREQIYLPGEFELPLFRALSAKCGEHSTVDIENLNSMIVGIRHDDSVSTGYSYVMRVL